MSPESQVRSGERARDRAETKRERMASRGTTMSSSTSSTASTEPDTRAPERGASPAARFRSGLPMRLSGWLSVAATGPGSGSAQRDHASATTSAGAAVAALPTRLLSLSKASKFVKLDGEVLSIHVDESSLPHEEVDLAGAVVEYAAHKNSKKDFTVIVPGRTLMFKCPSHVEMVTWATTVQHSAARSFSKSYQLGALISEGSYSKVYYAYPLEDVRSCAVPRSAPPPHQHARAQQPTALYAVKIIKKRAYDQEARTWVDRERHINTVLEYHRNVVETVDVFATVDRVYIVQEFMRGHTLSQLLHEYPILPEPHARIIMRDLFRGLSYIHAKNIVHRDIRPENMFLSAERFPLEVAIGDFGYSNFVEEQRVNSEVLTSMIGTVSYMATEIVRKLKHGAPADMWSAGVVLYQILSGDMPFRGRTDRDIFNAVRSAKFEMKGPAWNNISEQAKSLVRQLLQPNPHKRISAIAALQHSWFCVPVSVPTTPSHSPLPPQVRGRSAQSSNPGTSTSTSSRGTAVQEFAADAAPYSVSAGSRRGAPQTQPASVQGTIQNGFLAHDSFASSVDSYSTAVLSEDDEGSAVSGESTRGRPVDGLHGPALMRPRTGNDAPMPSVQAAIRMFSDGEPVASARNSQGRYGNVSAAEDNNLTRAGSRPPRSEARQARSPGATSHRRQAQASARETSFGSEDPAVSNWHATTASGGAQPTQPRPERARSSAPEGMFLELPTNAGSIQQDRVHQPSLREMHGRQSSFEPQSAGSMQPSLRHAASVGQLRPTPVAAPRRMVNTPTLRLIQEEGLSGAAQKHPERISRLLSSRIVQKELLNILPHRRRLVVVARAFIAVFRMIALKDGHSLTRQLAKIENADRDDRAGRVVEIVEKRNAAMLARTQSMRVEESATAEEDMAELLNNRRPRSYMPHMPQFRAPGFTHRGESRAGAAHEEPAERQPSRHAQHHASPTSRMVRSARQEPESQRRAPSRRR